MISAEPEHLAVRRLPGESVRPTRLRAPSPRSRAGEAYVFAGNARRWRSVRVLFLAAAGLGVALTAVTLGLCLEPASLPDLGLRPGSTARETASRAVKLHSGAVPVGAYSSTLIFTRSTRRTISSRTGRQTSDEY